MKYFKVFGDMAKNTKQHKSACVVFFWVLCILHAPTGLFWVFFLDVPHPLLIKCAISKGIPLSLFTFCEVGQLWDSCPFQNLNCVSFQRKLWGLFHFFKASGSCDNKGFAWLKSLNMDSKHSESHHASSSTMEPLLHSFGANILAKRLIGQTWEIKSSGTFDCLNHVVIHWKSGF